MGSVVLRLVAFSSLAPIIRNVDIVKEYGYSLGLYCNSSLSQSVMTVFHFPRSGRFSSVDITSRYLEIVG